MGDLVIWLVVAAILGAFTLYWYGRSGYSFQYEMEENALGIIVCIVFWPVAVPLAVAIVFNMKWKIGKFFYHLGERHKHKKDDV